MGLKFGQGKQLKGGGGGRDLSKLEVNLSKLPDGGRVKLRLLGEVLPNYRFWVTKRDGKKFPILTPFFDRETESLDSSDPLLGNGRKEFFYTVNAIDRDTGELKVLILKTTVYRYLYSLALDEDYGDPTDLENGYDIVIVKERTGPQPQNVKYNVSPSLKSKPLTEAEKKMELHDLEDLYCPKSKADYVEWIKENTNLLDDNIPYGEAEPAANTSTSSDVPF